MNERESLALTDADLEQCCPVCGGTKFSSIFKVCEACDGTGSVPNSTGEAILGLVRRNLKHMLHEIEAKC
jgi:hypothetical protein